MNIDDATFNRLYNQIKAQQRERRENAQANFHGDAENAFSSVAEVSTLIANGAPAADVVDAFFELRNHIEGARRNWLLHFTGDEFGDPRPFNDNVMVYDEKVGDYCARKEVHAAQNAVRCLVPIAARIYGDAIPIADLMI